MHKMGNFVFMRAARVFQLVSDVSIHPHDLRHTHALELASEGTPINTIQLQLVHGNASTTSTNI